MTISLLAQHGQDEKEPLVTFGMLQNSRPL